MNHFSIFILVSIIAENLFLAFYAQIRKFVPNKEIWPQTPKNGKK